MYKSVKVWIDQDLCTGDGLCAEIAPSIFEMADDGLAYVKEADWSSIDGPDSKTYANPVYKMSTGLATVPENLIDATIESAEECPGECIYIEAEV